MSRLFWEPMTFGGLYYPIHKPVRPTGIDVPAGLIAGQDLIQICTGSLIREVVAHPVSPRHPLQVIKEPGTCLAACRIMQFEVVPQRVQPVRKGNHWGNADAATHQEGLGRAFVQFKMIDGFGDKNPSSLGKNPVQHL